MLDEYCNDKFRDESGNVTTAKLPRVFGTIPSFRSDGMHAYKDLLYFRIFIIWVVLEKK